MTQTAATVTQPVNHALAHMERRGFVLTVQPAYRNSVEVGFDNRRTGPGAIFGVLRIGRTSGRFVGGSVTILNAWDSPSTRTLVHLSDLRTI